MTPPYKVPPGPPTAQQIVDAVRLLRYAGSFMSREEADRLLRYADARRDRYEALKSTVSFEESDMVASAEMLAAVLGFDASGIKDEVRGRFLRQRLRLHEELWKEREQAELAAYRPATGEDGE